MSQARAGQEGPRDGRGKAREVRAKHALHPRVEPLDSRVLLDGTPLSNNADTLLLLHFDGNLNGAAGEAPLASLGTGFVPGVIGQAMHTDNPGSVTYPTGGNILSSTGTIEFWIKPDWNGFPNPGHTFFQAGAPFNNGMILAIDGASNLRFIQWGDDPSTPQVEAGVERGLAFGASDWVPGKWHHIAATWNGSSGAMTFYVDGRAVASGSDGVAIPGFSSTSLTLGSAANGSSPAQATFEEFRISNRVHTAGEILADILSVRGTPPPGPTPPAGVNPDAIQSKVLLFVYDPIMENKGGLRQHQVYGGQDPISLTNQVVEDLRSDSHGLMNYQVVDTQVVDAYPYLQDGFRYDDASYDQAVVTGDFHNSRFDYNRFIADNNIAARIMSGEIDEVWLWTGNTDASRTWESTMAGDGAYWCNSSPVPNVPSSRAFVIMGWNFERGVAEALHSYGHRAESIMAHDYGRWQPDQADNWSKFTLLNKDAPSLGGVGNVHFPVNATSDYDYDNRSVVMSNADDWYNYPNFQGTTRSFNSDEWSPSHVDPHRDYLNWWYEHMPHARGLGTDAYLANWWRYLADPDQFKGSNSILAVTSGFPTVTTVSPANNSHVAGQVSILANASADGALGRVDLYIDGVYHSSDFLSPYTFTWDTTGLTGNHTIVTKAYELQNGTEAVAPPITVDLSPASTNSPPVLDPIGDRTIDEGLILTFVAHATDPDVGQSIFYSLGPGAPDGTQLHPTTGVFTWRPTEAQGPGQFTFGVRATDNGTPSLFDEEVVTITVREVNAPPVLSAIGNKSVNVGQALTFTAFATDPDLPLNTLVYSLDPGAPNGAQLHPTTGVFTWTPTVSQRGKSYPITVRVTDSGSPAMSVFETITVTVREFSSPHNDYDGDGKADVGVYRPGNATWLIKDAGTFPFGWAGVDIPVPADYNGDGKTDIAVYRPTNATWYVKGTTPVPFGWAGVDIPVPADYGGDGTADIAVYRPTNATWYVKGAAPVPFGWAGVDVPMPADYDGDGKTDIAVYRPTNATWYVRGVGTFPFGWAGVDIPVPADYGGDGKTDIAVYRPTNATWYVRGVGTFPFGWAGVDVPVPTDYGGDGKADIAVYRPTNGTWYVKGIGAIPFNWASGDIPLTQPLAIRLNGTLDVNRMRTFQHWNGWGSGSIQALGSAWSVSPSSDLNQTAVFSPGPPPEARALLATPEGPLSLFTDGFSLFGSRRRRAGVRWGRPIAT